MSSASSDLLELVQSEQAQITEKPRISARLIFSGRAKGANFGPQTDRLLSRCTLINCYLGSYHVPPFFAGSSAQCDELSSRIW